MRKVNKRKQKRKHTGFRRIRAFRFIFVNGNSAWRSSIAMNAKLPQRAQRDQSFQHNALALSEALALCRQLRYGIRSYRSSNDLKQQELVPLIFIEIIIHYKEQRGITVWKFWAESNAFHIVDRNTKIIHIHQ